MRHSRRKSGFTLLETLVALVLLVILTMMVVAVYRYHLISNSGTPTTESEETRPARSGPAGVSPRTSNPGDDSQRKFSE
ncbi:MAG: prepilin-type N-terminal cleavage/methylation domain-containing protein [Verrucomicrobium sp.]